MSKTIDEIRLVGVKRIILLFCISAVSMLLWHCRHANLPPDERPAQPPFRVGWQRAWAGQGEVMSVMQRTDVCRRSGVEKATLMSFVYGPDLNSAALTGQIDATNAGIVPVINLIDAELNSRSQGGQAIGKADWIAVCRQVDFLVGLVVRKSSGVESVEDLRDRRFAVPIKGGSHPFAFLTLENHGVSYKVGLESKAAGSAIIVDLQPPQHVGAMATNQIDASAVWEPTISRLLDDGHRLLESDTYHGFVMVRRSFAEKNRELVINLLKAYIRAFAYVATNSDASIEMFEQESAMDRTLLRKLHHGPTNVEKMFKNPVNDSIDLLIDPPRIQKTQQVSDTMRRLGLIKNAIRFEQYVDLSYYGEAKRQVDKEGLGIRSIKRL